MWSQLSSVRIIQFCWIFWAWDASLPLSMYKLQATNRLISLSKFVLRFAQIGIFRFFYLSKWCFWAIMNIFFDNLKDETFSTKLLQIKLRMWNGTTNGGAAGKIYRWVYMYNKQIKFCRVRGSKSKCAWSTASNQKHENHFNHQSKTMAIIVRMIYPLLGGMCKKKNSNKRRNLKHTRASRETHFSKLTNATHCICMWLCWAALHTYYFLILFVFQEIKFLCILSMLSLINVRFSLEISFSNFCG